MSTVNEDTNKTPNSEKAESSNIPEDEEKFIPKGDLKNVVINTETKNLEEDNTSEEKNCSMKEGSILASVFALSSIALGPGAFSLPIRCTQLGLFWYILLIIISALATYWTLAGLIRSARTVKGEDYSPTVKKIISKGSGIFSDIIIIVFLFGVFIQYQVVIYSLIGRTIYEFFGDKELYPDFDTYEQKVWDAPYLKFPIMYGIVIMISPICLLKDIGKMRFVSMFGICAYIYCISVVVIQSPWFFLDYLKKYKEDDPKTHANWFDISEGFTSEFHFFPSVANVFFTYTCHTGAFPVFKILKNNTEKRINTVFFRSICLDVIVYILVAFCGFITAPLKPQSLVIFRESVFKNDIFMSIAKIALATNLFLSLPANYVGYRCSVFMLAFGTDKIDQKKNYIITFVTLIVSALIGAVYKNILSYISFLGGFCSSLTNFLIPGVLIVKTSGEKLTSLTNITRLIVIIVLTTFGLMGGVQTIRNIILESVES